MIFHDINQPAIGYTPHDFGKPGSIAFPLKGSFAAWDPNQFWLRRTGSRRRRCRGWRGHRRGGRHRTTWNAADSAQRRMGLMPQQSQQLLNSAYQVASLISQTPWKEKATPFSQYLSWRACYQSAFLQHQAKATSTGWWFQLTLRKESKNFKKAVNIKMLPVNGCY